MPDLGSTSWPTDDVLELPSSPSTTSPLSAGDGNRTLLQWFQAVTGELRKLYQYFHGTGLGADLNFNSHKATNVTNGTASGDAVNKSQLDTKVDSVTAANSTVTIAGTATAPTVKVATSGVTDNEVAAGAAIAASKIANTAETQDHKGAASGYASLDASSRVVQSSKVHAKQGSDHTDAYQATTTKRITVPRDFGAINSGGSYLTSGTVYVERIRLPGGETYNNIVWWSGNTALARGTNGDSHLWFFLADSSLALVALTADDTSGAWAANSAKSLAIATIATGASASYTTPGTADADYYIGLMVNIGTGGTPALPQLWGAQVLQNEAALAPVLNGNSDTGQTTPPAFPKTFGALTAKGVRCKAELR